MKNRIGTIAVLFIVLLTFSCGKKDDSGDVELRFHLTYGGAPMTMFDNYTYPVTGEKLFFNRLSFYLSNVVLKGTDVEFNEQKIDYLDLTSSFTSPVAQNGYVYQIKDVPSGDYNSLTFSIGVPKAENALTPKDFNSTQILSNTSEYWVDWKSYIFFRPEGMIALYGEEVPQDGFALHLGGDEAYLTMSLDKNMTVGKDNIAFADITIDLEKFFNSNTFYNIQDASQIHSLSQNELVKALTKNLEQSIK